MLNKFCRSPLWEVTTELSAVAMGNKSAETVIKNARLVCVTTGEILENTDVAISCGRVALVGDASACIGENTEVIDAGGQYIAPGFLDGHIHVESSMLSVGEYARAVIPRGTTGIYMDPHEICNVLGMAGVDCMVADARTTPLKTMVTTPSCVPAVPGFEDTGASMDAADVAKSMLDDSTVGLGEMMNYPGILSSDRATHDIVAATLKADKTVTGHYSVPDTGAGLNAYIAAGVRCCHESTRAEDALQKMRLGMYAMFREGSAWHDLHEVARSITQRKIDTRFAVLVSDDTHPNTLKSIGHLDHLLRRAVQEGIDPVTAIQMVTINVAQCFRMDNELGSIAPSKCADIVFLRDLKGFEVTRVLIDGKTAALDGSPVFPYERYSYPDWAMNSVHIKNAVTPETFRIPSVGGEVNVIEVIPARVGTVRRRLTLPEREGFLQADRAQDVLKAAVFERHHDTGKIGYGFVRGFGISGGAMASTVAHDAHNLLVIGDSDEDMALAANTLIGCSGGMCVVKNGEVLGCVPLPIAGLMSPKSIDEMAALVAGLERAWAEIGCTMPSPFMTMALIPLACLPELRLTDRGLVDCVNYKLTALGER